MTTFQKVAKYCATALAICLIVLIFGGISAVMLSLTGVITSHNNETKHDKIINDELKDYAFKGESYDKLKIDVLAADVIIKSGDKFTVQYSGDGFSFDDEKGKLKIENSLQPGSAGQIVVTVPEKKSFKKIELNAGAGSVVIDWLLCDVLDFDLGAGRAEIDYLKVTSQGDIDCGVGELKLNSGELNNLDISLGVGKTTMRANFTGKSSVEAGVGKLDLVLLGGKKSYTIDAESGLGEFKLENEKITGKAIIGDGSSLVELDGDIGSVNVTFE